MLHREHTQHASEQLLTASSWREAYTLVRSFPGLLDDDVLTVYRLTSERLSDPEDARRLRAIITLLTRGREVGLPRSFAENITLGWPEDRDEFLQLPVVAQLMIRAEEALVAAQETGENGFQDLAAWVVLRALKHTTLPNLPAGAHVLTLEGAATVLLTGYRKLNPSEALDPALPLLERLLAHTALERPDLPATLADLSTALFETYRHRGRLECLEASMRIAQTTLERLDASHPVVRILLNTLSGGLRTRFERQGNLTDLDRAIQMLQEAFELHHRNAPGESVVALVNLASGLLQRFDARGSGRDLDEAIERTQAALTLVTPDSPEYPALLMHLSTALRSQPEVAQSGGLQEPVRLLREALEHTPLDAALRPILLNHLGIALKDVFLATGEATQIEESITVSRNAVASTPADSPNRGLRLVNLGVSLMESSEHGGEYEHLNEALDAFQEAAVFLANQPQAADLQNNLGTALWLRHLRTGNHDDLEQSVEALSEAVALTRVDSPARCSRLSNLGLVLQNRAFRLKRDADFDASLQKLEEASTLAPKGSLLRGATLNNLGIALRTRYTRSRHLNELAYALQVLENCVEETPASSPHYAGHLHNLGITWMDRYERLHERPDLEQATEILLRAVASTPEGAHTRPRHLRSLANVLAERYAIGGDSADWAAAARTYEEACRTGLTLLPEIALAGAIDWGRQAFDRRNWSEATRAYTYGRDALESLYRVQLLRSSRESWLAAAHGLHAHAAYALAREGKAEEAAIVLERSRARVLGDALARDRADLEQVQAMHPEVYARYSTAVNRLRELEALELSNGRPLRETAWLPDDEALRGMLREAHKDVEAAITALRALPGHGQFLALPGQRDLERAVEPGMPLVYLVSTSDGSLGLIVSRPAPDGLLSFEAVLIDAVTSTELDRLLVTVDGEEAVGGYLPALLENSSGFKHSLTDVLQLLGVLVAPVMERLRVLDASGVCWIPGGRLALLPLHAAVCRLGCHNGHLLDEFPVAYAPSARVLATARASLTRKASPALCLAGVGDPTCSDLPPLPYAGSELETISALFPVDAQNTLFHAEATLEDLLEALPGASHLHLSCHGIARPDFPLESSIELSDCSWDLRSILSQDQLRGLRSVVLSACQTAVPEFHQLLDEAIMLSAGFLQAGVPGVVGSLWSVNDRATALLMIRFYQVLLKCGTSWEAPFALARSLRTAQQWLRDLTITQLVEWLDQSRLDVPNSPTTLFALMAPFVQDCAKYGPDYRPFSHPYYWAAFTAYGV